MTNLKSTCQICARPIKSKNGIIAHHGYRRPGDGWQTPSCMGAKYRPYEVACDAIGHAIEDCMGYIISTAEALEDYKANPPATIEYQRTNAWGVPDGELKIYHKPENFQPHMDVTVSGPGKQYDFHFASRSHKMARNIKDSQESLKYLKERLAKWKAPVE